MNAMERYATAAIRGIAGVGCVCSVMMVANSQARADPHVKEKTVAFVAISSIRRCRDVKLNQAGEALVLEMTAKLRAGEPTVRSLGKSAAAQEMELMKSLKYGHCKNVQARYPQFVEPTAAP